MASYDGEAYEDEDEALDELAYEAAEGPGSRMGADVTLLTAFSSLGSKRPLASAVAGSSFLGPGWWEQAVSFVNCSAARTILRWLASSMASVYGPRSLRCGDLRWFTP
jgi:hypothetical protein